MKYTRWTKRQMLGELVLRGVEMTATEAKSATEKTLRKRLMETEEGGETKTVKTFTAHIYVGLQSEYSGIVNSVAVAEDVCHEYVDDVGLCVTVTPTTFIYTNGAKPGVIVGFINYPRFESTAEQIETHAIELAQRLLRVLGQHRVSVVMPEKTVMLEANLCPPAPTT